MTFARSASSLAVLSTLAFGSVWAQIPIETRPLSQNTPPPAANTPSTPTEPLSSEQASTLWKLYQQVQQLEQEIRLLRGRAESQEQLISQLQRELSNRYTDLDQRLEQWTDQLKAVTSPNNSATSPNPAETSPAAPAANAGATLASTATPTVPAPAVVNSVSTNSNNPPATANNTDPDADKRAYVAAYDAYRAGGAAKAVAPMRQFINSFPSSVYVPNAHYWLGEFYLALTPADFANAKASFQVVLRQYPKSAKAAAATYRLATLAEVDNQRSEAVRLMQLLLAQYPNSKEAEYAATFLKAHNPAPSRNTKNTEKTNPSTNTGSKPASTGSTPKPTTKPSASTTGNTAKTGAI